MEYQRPLSDDFVDRISQPDAQAILEHIHHVLWMSVDLPFRDFAESRRTDKRFRGFRELDAAWWLHKQIRDTASELCGEFSALAITPPPNPDCQQFYLTYQDKVVLIFKKLLRRFNKVTNQWELVRSNAWTSKNQELWEGQMRLPGIPDIPRLVVGYRLVSEMSKLQMHVGLPQLGKRRGFDWNYRLPSFAMATKEFLLARAETREQTSVMEKRKRYSVRLRKDSKEHEG